MNADYVEVTPERYVEIVTLLERRRILKARLHGGMKNATLAQKLAVNREIQDINEELAR